VAHKFIQHLIEDHEKQRALGEQLRTAKSADQREKLREEMYEELYPHVEGEDASIFDYMQAHDGKTREQALQAMQEHHAGKILLRELMDLSLDSEIFNAKAYVLDEMNRHHMDEEEHTHFPTLERLASEQEMNHLFNQYKQAEERVQPS
jgi:hemerythrin-like domain-containing protein